MKYLHKMSSALQYLFAVQFYSKMKLIVNAFDQCNSFPC